MIQILMVVSCLFSPPTFLVQNLIPPDDAIQCTKDEDCPDIPCYETYCEDNICYRTPACV